MFCFASVYLLWPVRRILSAPVHSWKVESKKIGEGKYELIFSTPVAADWKIYAPNQVLLDVKTTELNFADSAIKQDGDFVIED